MKDAHESHKEATTISSRGLPRRKQLNTKEQRMLENGHKNKKGTRKVLMKDRGSKRNKRKKQATRSVHKHLMVSCDTSRPACTCPSVVKDVKKSVPNTDQTEKKNLQPSRKDGTGCTNVSGRRARKGPCRPWRPPLNCPDRRPPSHSGSVLLQQEKLTPASLRSGMSQKSMQHHSSPECV